MKKSQKNLMVNTLVISFVFIMLGLTGPIAALAATTPSLGLAATYGILGSTYTNTSAGTTINGDVGFTTGPAVLPLGTHANYGSGVPYATAGSDQGSALSALASQTCTFTFGGGAIDLSTDTTHGTAGVYTPGVYCGSGAMDVGGPLTLNGSGTYIFRPGGALTSTVGAIVTLNGVCANDVFWTPAQATTLAANTTFAGTVIDDSGITVGANITWTGRALSFGETVTTDTDTITVPTCAVAPASATLHVVKQVIDDNGSTVTAAFFNLHVKLANADVADSPAAGVVSPGKSYSLAPGAYAVSEDYDASYAPSFSGDCDSSGNITLAAGDNKTCTITNTRIQMYLPTMPTCEGIFGTVISSVDHSGFHYGNIPEEWAYFAVASSTHGDSLDNSWVQGVNNPIIWDLGALTENIRVYPSQDHGGYPTEYFNEYAVQVSSDNLTWQSAVIGATYAVASPAAIRVHDGARDFSSTTPFRYVKISLNPITGIIGGCDFEIDAVKSCAVNIPPPMLTVTKVVINDNGGTKVISDFPLFIDGVSVTSGAASTTSAGAHIVSETADSSYTSTIGGDYANVFIDAFESPAFDHTMASTGEIYTRVDSGLNVIGGSRALSYTQLVSAGGGNSVSIYQNPNQFTSSNGSGGESYFEFLYDSLGAGLNADLSQQEKIEVLWRPDHLAHWNEQPPTINQLNFMSFTLTDAADHSYESKISWTTDWHNVDYIYLTTAFDLNDFATNGVSLSSVKSILFRYESDNSNDLNIKSLEIKHASGCAADGTITLLPGDVKTCTITNNDKAPSLTLLKTVTNDNGGDALNTAWTLTATGASSTPTNLTGTALVASDLNFIADTYTLAESGDPSGYTASSWSCVGASVTGASVTIGLGDTVTCTITNNDIAPVAPGGGGVGGGGSIPLCILTNTCGSANPILTSAPAGVASPSFVASSTGEVLGEKITAKPVEKILSKPVINQVLGEKITVKPADKILSETGFNLSEFLALLAVLWLLLNLIFIIKTKYLKTTLKI